MTLSQEYLQTHLGDRPFQFFESVDSTNDIAMQWVRDGAVSGSVVIADEQRKGRGRLGRTWYTPPQVALAVSVVLHPPIAVASRVSLLGALSVLELCHSLNIQNVGIKWPNDVQIQGKKVCGVLPEAVWQQGQLIGVVLGMGVNVRVDFQPEVASIATNLEEHSAKRLDRATLITTLLSRVDYWALQISSDALVKTWKAHLNTLNARVAIDGVQGIAVDVDADCALLIKTDNGTIERMIAGDVSLI